ncbi:MAG: DUF4131 domain-containing protein, partial [Bacilli bacterium]|nr:DUF4131 domain-containing protein [Bacilli bacterium]
MLRLKTILQSSHLILILLIITIIYSLIYSNIPVTSEYNINDTLIRGTCVSKSIDGDKLTIVLKGKEKIKGTFYIKKESDVSFYENIPLGTNLEITGTLSIPNNNTIPNTFNYKDYLYYQGINYNMSINTIRVNIPNISCLYKIKNMSILYINKYICKAYLLT